MAQRPVLPNVGTFLIADSAFQQNTGKWCIVGVFDGIMARSFPVVHGSVGVLLQMSGLVPGRHGLQLILKGGSDNCIAEGPEVGLEIPEGHDPVQTIHIGLQTCNLTLPSEGVYFVHVLFDGEPLIDARRIEACRVAEA